MGALKQNECRFCRKVFCCQDCRGTHEKNKHPVAKCNLCFDQPVFFKPPSSCADEEEEELKPEKSEVLCHIVFNHLPLHCKLCGERYSTNLELLAAKPCRFTKDHHSDKQAADKKHHRPVKTALPVTPQQQQQQQSTDVLSSAVQGSSLKTRLKVVEHFSDSPPTDLVCHTSTPMHGAAVSNAAKHLNGQLTGKHLLPNFFLKTPSSACKRSFAASVSSISSSSTSSSEQSRYFTGVGSSVERILLAERFDSGENQFEADLAAWNTPSLKSTSKPNPSFDPLLKKERSILKPDLLERLLQVRGQDDSTCGREDSIEKRVRFSDQLCVPTYHESSLSSDNTAGTNASADDDMTANSADSDIFFEAKENLDPEEDANAQKLQDSNHCKCHGCGQRQRCQPTTNKSDQQQLKNENVAIVSDKLSANASTTSTSSTSSRVVMMLVVEQTDSKSFSSMNLAPLIDSGLKQLEQNGAFSNQKSDNGSVSISCEKAQGECLEHFASSTLQASKEMSSSSLGPQRMGNSLITAGSRHHHHHHGCAQHPNGGVRAIKDFVSISGRVECFSTPKQEGNLSHCTRRFGSDLDFEIEEREPNSSCASLPGVDDHNNNSNSSGTNTTGSNASPSGQKNPSGDDDGGGGGGGGGSRSDGIFSVVARVVRSAFNKLPAAISGQALVRSHSDPGCCINNNLANHKPYTAAAAQPNEHKQHQTPRGAHVTRRASLSFSAREEITTVIPHGGATSSEQPKRPLQRSASSIQVGSKRPRATTPDSNEEHQQQHQQQYQQQSNARHYANRPARDSPGTAICHSPVAKRHRGWYRIRGREPIARMRQLALTASPRGASRETQRFQQGSLSIGDTFLPLPSRAHQSTQTEQ